MPEKQDARRHAVGMYTLPYIIQEIHDLNTAKGWREEGADGAKTGPWFAAYIGLAGSELGEALDAYRDNVWSETCDATEPGIGHNRACSGKAHKHPKPVGVGPELADALIRVLDMVDIWDIDIIAELTRVLEYGWTRPHQHGGRVL